MAVATNAGKKIVTKKSGHVAVADGSTDVYNEQGKPVPYSNTVPCHGVQDASTNTTIGGAIISLFRSFYGPADQKHAVPSGATSGGFNGVARPIECSKDVRVEGVGLCRTDDKTKHNTTSAGNTTGKHVEGKGKDSEADKKLCIDWAHIKKAEKTANDGYVPANIDKKTGKLKRIAASGVTVATGVDLGQLDPSKLGLSADLAKKLQPYYGLSADQINAYANKNPDAIGQKQIDNWNKKHPAKPADAKPADPKAAAAKPADAKPAAPEVKTPDKLNLTDAEVKELDGKVKEKFEKDLARSFNKKGKTQLADLPCAVQTALMSTYYNSPGAAAKLYDKVRSGDYAGARDALYGAQTSNKGIANRRHEDGALFNQALPKDQQQSYAQWKTAQDAAAAKAKADAAAAKAKGGK